VSSVVSRFEVRSTSGNYPVLIGVGLLQDAAKHVDSLVLDQCLRNTVPHGESRDVLVQAGEQLKTLESCGEILTRLKERGLTRASVLGACGGGSVQDAVTLVASLYMRGISWEFFPSTAMSALDSCIGGKSAINVGPFKNLAGNFHPPRRVIIDVDLLDDLSTTALSSGLAEAVKICFARGPKVFSAFLDLESRAGVNQRPSVDAALVEFVLRQKAWFIEIDEFDVAERQLLNFGHTFAHALESATGYRIPHGLAVAYGVTAACLHPLAATTDSTEALVEYNRGLIAASDQHPQAVLPLLDPERFKYALENDKKGTPNNLIFILPNSSGGLSKVSVPRGQESSEQALYALEAAFATLAA